jgi:hypothetical protein
VLWWTGAFQQGWKAQADGQHSQQTLKLPTGRTVCAPPVIKKGLEGQGKENTRVLAFGKQIL